MFAQVLTTLKGLFSRSFWFGKFLPVAIVAALHLAIAEASFPGLTPVADWIASNFADTAQGLSLFVVALVIVAYALAPFTPLVRDFLDGSLMPGFLHDWLRRDREPGWRTATEKLRSARDDRGRFAQMKAADIQRIWDAARKGNELKAVQDIGSIDAAISAVQAWQNDFRLGQLPDAGTTDAAVEKLCDALSRNASNLQEADADFEPSSKLAQAKGSLIELIDEADHEALYVFTQTAAKYYRLDLYPTRIGDARWAAERYSQDTYGVDFDFVWSRIQLLLDKNDDTEFLTRLDDSRSQVDYAAMSLVLAVTVPLIWLPVLLFNATTPWLFLTIGLLSPAIVFFLYESVVQSQMVFGEIVRVAIDKYRLDVLTKIMRQPLPATLAAERQLWQGLKSASEPGNRADLSYRHPE